MIDVHVHLAASAAIGAWSTADYEIWEYGAKDGVRFGRAAGGIDDLRAAMAAGGIDHAVLVNAFSIDEWQRRWREGVEDPPPDRSLASALVRYNEWLVDTASGYADLTPFVAVDPDVLAFDKLADHLTKMRERGARGVKIHPIEQRFVASDPRMLAVYRLCVELDLTVLSHSGMSRGRTQYADPRAFIDVLDAVPDLRLVVAHLGGGSWQQVRELAACHQQVTFDLSEIVAWCGAPNGPNEEELARLIRDVGVERVMFGSDFPWYEPREMADLVRGLPGLSIGDVDAILGGNAARILSLPG